MNRFRSRKKSTGNGGDGSRRPSIDSESVPSLPSFSSRTFRKKKQEPAPEPKPELDLSTALPDNNDFRTSLLMPNLSARFSMLREQDDPNSKLGKANDDSVLFPKRASRLDLFNSGRQQGLSDIAEADSLRGSLRPPLAQHRTDSFTLDGYGTDGEGNVMSRSRPGEGNTMFGGRQKIYKIPVGQSGSAKKFGSAEDGDLAFGGNMGGKALYESDTLPSAFQIMREQERAEREKAANDHFNNARSSNDQDRSGSPPSAKYNRNRETSSSTNSGPSQPRTSTAATSIASQRSIYGAHETFNGSSHGPVSGSHSNSAGSDRPMPRAKKLYGQGFEQSQYDSQSSSLQRINSLNRNRGGGVARSLTPSRSASNLRDGHRGGYMPGGPLYSSNGFRAGSPPLSNTPPRMQEFDLGLGIDNISPISPGHTDSGYGASPQMIAHVSPPMSPLLDTPSPNATLVAALEPNDLGKATASGAFNKPKKQYDEQQYLQRQLQLQEGRNTPSPGPGAMALPFSPPGPIFNEQAMVRSRNNSQASGLSRSNSVMHPWEHQMEDRKMRSVAERGRSPSTRRGSEEQATPAMERSFFGFGGSEVGESESEGDPTSPPPSKSGFQSMRPSIPPSVNEVEPAAPFEGNAHQYNHEPSPRHLSQPFEESTSDSRSYRSETTVTPRYETSHQSMPLSEDNPTINFDPDSPTLGPVGISNDLSGMVRQHLRNASGTSSVYPEDSPRRSRSSRPEVRESIFGHGSALDEQEWKDEVSHDDHWVRRTSQKPESEEIPPLPQPLHSAARHMLAQAQALKAQEAGKLKQMTGNDKAQRVLGGEAPRTNHGHHEQEPPWQEQLKRNHRRGPSAETQMERESLAMELEARKRAVRSNLQTFAEGQSRDASPAPSAGTRTHEGSPARSGHPFSILKKGASKAVLDRNPAKQEKPTKAMKMLGIDSNVVSGASDGGPPPDPFMGREQPPSQKNLKQLPQDVRQNLNDSPSKRQRAFFGSRNHQTSERPSISSSISGSANSDSSDRHPRSRKDSKEKASLDRNNVDGYEHNGVGLAGDELHNVQMPTSNTRMHYSPATGRSRSASRMRSRSNSKPSAPGFFETQQRVAPPGTPVMINPSTGGRPSAHPHPYSANSAPSIHDHLSNHPTSNIPLIHPTMINPHPPHSPRSQQGFAAKFGGGNSRNRSINKHHISEPTFISSTSSVDTVSLPPGASLSNGMESRPACNESDSPDVPPIPHRDSRRKRTQTLLATLSGRKSPQESASAVTSPTQSSFFYNPTPNVHQREQPAEEQSNFSADDEPSPEMPSSNGGRKFSFERVRLRKTSSEGGNMNQKAKLQALEEVRPGLPYRAPGDVDGSGEPVSGEHVQYQAERDVPASAVMF